MDFRRNQTCVKAEAGFQFRYLVAAGDGQTEIFHEERGQPVCNHGASVFKGNFKAISAASSGYVAAQSVFHHVFHREAVGGYDEGGFGA